MSSKSWAIGLLTTICDVEKEDLPDFVKRGIAGKPQDLLLFRKFVRRMKGSKHKIVLPRRTFRKSSKSLAILLLLLSWTSNNLLL